MKGAHSDGFDVRTTFTLPRLSAYAVELQDVFDRMLTLSVGSIALLATFAEKFSGGTSWLGAVSLIAFGVTILSCLSVRCAAPTWKLFYGSASSPGGQGRTQGSASSPELKNLEAQLEVLEAKRAIVGSKLTMWLACSIFYAMVAFVTALIFLTAFAVTALV